MDTFERDREYIVGTYGRFPLEIVSGVGSLAYDAEGNGYIDMGAGIAVNTFGYADQTLIAAVTAQLGEVQHTSNLYYNAPCALLAEALVRRSGMKKVFFCNSGAEANECAIKTARKWGEDHKGVKGGKIVTLVNSFHGRTVTTLSATGQEVFHHHFDPFTPGFLYVPINDTEALDAALSDPEVVAVMVEFVQGEGGVNLLAPHFLSDILAAKEKYDLLLIADEVQTGNGRTGKYFAYQHFGILPDLVTTAKGLGGGLPIGACLFGEQTEKVLGAGDHGSTFGGNPAIAAGALTVVERLDDSFLQTVEEKGNYIYERLKKMKGVLSVSGMGLMLGAEVAADAKKVVAKCLEKGALFLTAKNKVRLLPALNIPYDLIDRALDILEQSIEETL